jgi:hypothetical protein
MREGMYQPGGSGATRERVVSDVAKESTRINIEEVSKIGKSLERILEGLDNFADTLGTKEARDLVGEKKAAILAIQELLGKI